MADPVRYLRLKHLYIEAVRNIRRLDVALSPGCNYFYGPNGAGKTSILEALYILARGRTFRGGKPRDWISRAADMARVAVTFQNRLFPDQVPASGAGRQHRIGLERSPAAWQARIDGRNIAHYAELSRRLPVLLFEPRIHELIESGPARRREFLDWGVFHVEPDYIDVWRRYHKALRQCNRALKAQAEDNVLTALHPVMAGAAAGLHAMRRAFCEALSDAFARVQEQLSPDFDRLQLEYEPGFQDPDALEKDWREALSRDRQRGFLIHGPHRADLRLRIAERQARNWLSRGQQKLTALMLLLAMHECWQTVSRQGAVLLFDDIISELDERHYHRLLGVLQGSGQQVLMTGTRSDVVLPEQTSMFHVEQGAVFPDA